MNPWLIQSTSTRPVPEITCAGPLISVPTPTICELSPEVRSWIAPDPENVVVSGISRIEFEAELSRLSSMMPLLVAAVPMTISRLLRRTEMPAVKS